MLGRSIRTRRRAATLWCCMVALAGCSSGVGAGAVDAALDDGTVTDGEVEQAWRLAEECLLERGAEARAEQDALQRWGISITGDHDQADYEDCSETAEEVSRLYLVERVPEGAERLELARSLADCWAEVGVTEIPFNPAERDESRMLAAAIEQLGYRSGEQALLDDPRFDVVLDCVHTHELLFPAFFDPTG